MQALTNIQRPDELFERLSDKLNVRHAIKLGLSQALEGWNSTIETLNGVVLQVECAGPTHPGHIVEILGVGLPLYSDPDQRGSLIIDLSFEFNSALTDAQEFLCLRLYANRLKMRVYLE